MTSVVLTGIKPTGRPHLGNFVGMIQPLIRLAQAADGSEVFLFIADYHALNALRDPEQLRSYTYDIAATLLALGLDTEKAVLFRQSDIPETFELATILSAVTPKGLMNRAHAYKAATERNASEGKDDHDVGINMGLYTYPILMTADILLYDADTVPVGRDQVQHVEFARDIAGSFNRLYGETFKLSAHLVTDEGGVIPGIDGRKMSKSYDNIIPVFSDPEALRRQVMRIVTDSRPPGEPKDPDAIPVYQIYRALGSEGEVREMEGRFRAGLIGYGDAKKVLYEKLVSMFSEPGRRYRQLLESTHEIDQVLLEGARKARERAKAMIGKVRKRIGVQAPG